jgi:hypothetical protein
MQQEINQELNRDRSKPTEISCEWVSEIKEREVVVTWRRGWWRWAGAQCGQMLVQQARQKMFFSFFLRLSCASHPTKKLSSTRPPTHPGTLIPISLSLTSSSRLYLRFLPILLSVWSLFCFLGRPILSSCLPLSLSSLVVVLREGVDTDVGCLLLVGSREREGEGEGMCNESIGGGIYSARETKIGWWWWRWYPPTTRWGVGCHGGMVQVLGSLVGCVHSPFFVTKLFLFPRLVGWLGQGASCE